MGCLESKAVDIFPSNHPPPAVNSYAAPEELMEEVSIPKIYKIDWHTRYKPPALLMAVQLANKVFLSPEAIKSLYYPLLIKFYDNVSDIYPPNLDDLLVEKIMHSDPSYLKYLTNNTENISQDYYLNTAADSSKTRRRIRVADYIISSVENQMNPSLVIFLFFTLLHESAHLFTEIMNSLVGNSANKQRTPDKIGTRFNSAGEEVSDNGIGFEECILGKGTTVYPNLDNPLKQFRGLCLAHIDIQARDITVKEIPVNIIKNVFLELMDWNHDRSGMRAFPIVALREMNYDNILSLTTETLRHSTSLLPLVNLQNPSSDILSKHGDYLLVTPPRQDNSNDFMQRWFIHDDEISLTARSIEDDNTQNNDDEDHEEEDAIYEYFKALMVSYHDD